MSLLMLLPDVIVCEILSPEWLDLTEVAKVDSAVCSKIDRNNFLDILSLIKFQTKRTVGEFKINSLHWFCLRNLKIVNLTISLDDEMLIPFQKLYSTHIIGLNLLYSFAEKDTFVAIINLCSNLKYLDLGGGSDYFLHEISPEILNQLEELNASNEYWLPIDESNEQLNRNEFMVIVNHCKSLRKISDGLFCWYGASFDDSILLLNKSPLLQQINTIDLGNTNDSILRHVAKYCPNLEVLDITVISLNNDDILTCISSMLTQLTNIQSVCICFCEYLDLASNNNELTVVFEYVNLCKGSFINKPTAKTVYIDCTIIEANKSELDQVEHFFTEFDNFTEISLVDSSKGEQYEIGGILVRYIVLNNRNTLENLNFNNCISSFIPHDYCLIFQVCKYLRVLEIHYCVLSDLEFYNVFSIPTKLNSLTLLCCFHRISQRSILCLLENSPRITELNLDDCCKVTDREDKISAILKSRGGAFSSYNNEYKTVDPKFHVRYAYEERLENDDFLREE